MEAVLSAADLRRALVAARDAVRQRVAELDALNVFPVADADTGTNLAATLDAVVEASVRAPEQDLEIARAIRSGSLMGARGNSGVILAQILRAWAEAVEAGPADAETMARSFKRAVEFAYEAVLEPAEGTILTVLRAATDGAQGNQESPGERFASAARAAVAALTRTRTENPVLTRADVVDAGAAGLTIALAAMAESLGGSFVDVPVNASATAWLCDAPSFGFEVMYIVRAPDESIASLRHLLGTIGDSVAVVGGDGEWRAHVHTDDRMRAIAIGKAVGTVSDVQVVSFAEQIHGARGIGLSRAATAGSLVAVVDGEGAQRLYRGLGALVVPDIGELREAIERAPSPSVIVLPNDEAIHAEALAIAAGVEKAVTVLPSSNIVAGLAAAVAFGDARPAEENIAEMREILRGVHTDATDNDARGAASRLLAGGGEVLTVLCGAGVDAGDRATLARELERAHPGISIEIHDGGQSGARYLLAVE